MGEAIEAAGGVVWRRGGWGQTEVVLVHRPKRDDWTLPAGRLEPGESIEDCAVREVREETGLDCALGPLLETIEFVGEDDDLTHRQHFFSMTALSGDFRVNDETDRAPWLALDEARRTATYDNVRQLLVQFEPKLTDEES